MSSANTHTQEVTDVRDSVENTNPNGSVTLSVWGRECDVYPWLLPLKHRQYDPIAVCDHIQSKLDGMPELQERFSAKEIGINTLGGWKDDLLRLFNVTVADGSKHKTIYYNPNYLHYETVFDTITDTEERIQFYDKHVVAATVDPEWFSTHFGIKTNSVRKFTTRNGLLSPQKRLTIARRRITRTIYTAAEWSDWTVEDIVSRTTLTYSTVRGWLVWAVNDAEWQPPERPVGNRAFAYDKNPDHYVDKPWWEESPAERGI